MSGKPSKPVKHIPQRTCVGCHTVLPKRTMTRLVRTSDGVWVDPTGKRNGRGAYLHNQQSCWERALKGSLAHALKVELSDQDRKRLEDFMQTLPVESA